MVSEVERYSTAAIAATVAIEIIAAKESTSTMASMATIVSEVEIYSIESTVPYFFFFLKVSLA